MPDSFSPGIVKGLLVNDRKCLCASVWFMCACAEWGVEEGGRVNSEGTFINDVNARIPVTFSVKYASQYRSGVFFEGGTHTFQFQPINHRLYNFIFGSFCCIFSEG